MVRVPKARAAVGAVLPGQVIAASDVVLEVLDARDPLGCRCPQVEEAIVQSQQKRLVLVLNKSDLVPKENLEGWLNYLKQELPTVVFRASTSLKDRGKMSEVYFTVSVGRALLPDS